MLLQSGANSPNRFISGPLDESRRVLPSRTSQTLRPGPGVIEGWTRDTESGPRTVSREPRGSRDGPRRKPEVAGRLISKDDSACGNVSVKSSAQDHPAEGQTRSSEQETE